MAKQQHVEGGSAPARSGPARQAPCAGLFGEDRDHPVAARGVTEEFGDRWSRQFVALCMQGRE